MSTTKTKTGIQTFQAFKAAVFAGFPGRLYMVPGNNWLYVRWELGIVASDVITEILENDGIDA